MPTRQFRAKCGLLMARRFQSQFLPSPALLDPRLDRLSGSAHLLIAVESVELAGNPRSPFGLSETLGVAMRNHVILFDDTFGHSVIVWSAGLLQ